MKGQENTGQITILTLPERDSSDVNLVKLIGLCGVECNVIERNGLDKGVVEEIERRSNGHQSAIMVNAGFWASALEDKERADKLRHVLFSKGNNLMLYNLAPSLLKNSILGHLSYQICKGVTRPTGESFSYRITEESRQICKQFAGLSFEGQGNPHDCVIEGIAQSEDFLSIVSLNGSPFFGMLRRDQCNLFVLASDRILDIDQLISKPLRAKECFSQLVPVLMFARYACEDYCWHSKQGYASLIIDDPLLRKTYGFLTFDTLLRQMDEDSFFTNIAFIPWNHTRTRADTASIFRKRADRLMLCVHGCDHIKNEFGTTDFSQLEMKVRLATERMTNHQKSTGVGFDKVFVFPQGKFSTVAMKAMKCGNYHAVVNSELGSVDEAGGVKISDFLDGAIMSYYSFPLFPRRYQGDLIDFALDLFMGKPAFIVTHHKDFKLGYGGISDLVKGINSLDGELKWDSLGRIISRFYIEKKGSNGNSDVKVFSRCCTIVNTHGCERSYTIRKRECGRVPLKGVMVDGKNVPYRVENGELRLEVRIGPKSAANFAIVYVDKGSSRPLRTSMAEGARIAVRRYLSEFRDNVISKNDRLSSIAQGIISLVRK